MNNIAGALYRVIKIKNEKRHSVAFNLLTPAVLPPTLKPNIAALPRLYSPLQRQRFLNFLHPCGYCRSNRGITAVALPYPVMSNMALVLNCWQIRDVNVKMCL